MSCWCFCGDSGSRLKLVEKHTFKREPIIHIKSQANLSRVGAQLNFRIKQIKTSFLFHRIAAQPFEHEVKSDSRQFLSFCTIAGLKLVKKSGVCNKCSEGAAAKLCASVVKRSSFCSSTAESYTL